ncbi:MULTISPECIES: IS481 family transposase [Pseudomonadota]|uniref:IS481 family transposase n=1 Tax=Pseudomonadota TaxID=1224 RepID=UPI001CA5F49F|nr:MULTISPECIES: IS481 family transposase [Pseudomonadota]MBY8965953.1 IS481 family transposase [Algiphilus acroporae]MCI5069294.1 IS481 family transposase [Acidovorax sp.]MCI5102390.1 IS481 family transposase [Algiphilus sp.]
MPWKEHTRMSQRTEFVALAHQQGVSVSELARRFGISRKTAYKWLARAEAGASMADRSRRPRHSPARTPPEAEQAVVALRRQYPCWGGRKLRRILLDRGMAEVPAESTITHILRRHGLLTGAQETVPRRWQHFEHAAPNDLWQMDFKGTIRLGQGSCDPLTVIDDHSRYNLVLRVVSDMRTTTVQTALTDAFRRYGLPVRINTDNGAPWGSPRNPGVPTALSFWLVRLGIRISFSAPAHPQTNGKNERFHRCLKTEVINGRALRSTDHLQASFDHWWPIYNQIRSHEALGLATPASRYRPSPRPFPERLPPIEYAPDDLVVVANSDGLIRFRGQPIQVPKALRGLPVAIRPRHDVDGLFDLFFSHHHFDSIDLSRHR